MVLTLESEVQSLKGQCAESLAKEDVIKLEQQLKERNEELEKLQSSIESEKLSSQQAVAKLDEDLKQKTSDLLESQRQIDSLTQEKAVRSTSRLPAA